MPFLNGQSIELCHLSYRQSLRKSNFQLSPKLLNEHAGVATARILPISAILGLKPLPNITKKQSESLCRYTLKRKVDSG